jgi:ATP-dependent Lhr-like helicase
VYEVLKTLEESGRVRRGYFIGGLGGAQFALPTAVDLLRSFRDLPEEPNRVVVAATDPANPYGAIARWPFDGNAPAEGPSATRSAGARVILVDGVASGYLRRGERELLLYAPDVEPQRSRVTREVARALLELATAREPGRQGMLIAEINGTAAATHPAAPLFVAEGFSTTAMGIQARPVPGRGIAIAGSDRGGRSMADTPRSTPDDAGTTSKSEHDAIRSSNDRDQAAEREGIETEHNRGYDDAARGRTAPEREDPGDVDPDSAQSDVDRDDTATE